MVKSDFVTKKLRYYIENFNSLTDEEIKQSQYLVLYKANEHMNKYQELIKEVQEQNQELIKVIECYERFIKDAGIAKEFEFYAQKGRV